MLQAGEHATQRQQRAAPPLLPCALPLSHHSRGQSTATSLVISDGGYCSLACDVVGTARYMSHCFELSVPSLLLLAAPCSLSVPAGRGCASLQPTGRPRFAVPRFAVLRFAQPSASASSVGSAHFVSSAVHVRSSHDLMPRSVHATAWAPLASRAPPSAIRLRIDPCTNRSSGVSGTILPWLYWWLGATAPAAGRGPWPLDCPFRRPERLHVSQMS